MQASWRRCIGYSKVRSDLAKKGCQHGIKTKKLHIPYFV